MTLGFLLVAAADYDDGINNHDVDVIYDDSDQWSRNTPSLTAVKPFCTR